jgi:hypothetical protein
MKPHGDMTAEALGSLQAGELDRGSDRATGDLAFLNMANNALLSNHAHVPPEGHHVGQHPVPQAHAPAKVPHVVQVRSEELKIIPDLQILEPEASERSITVKPEQKDEKKRDLPPVPVMQLWRYRYADCQLKINSTCTFHLSPCATLYP